MKKTTTTGINTILIVIISVLSTIVVLMSAIFGFAIYKHIAETNSTNTSSTTDAATTQNKKNKITNDVSHNAKDDSKEVQAEFTLSGNQIDTLTEYALRLPNCNPNTINTTDYAVDFIFYYYTGKQGNSCYNDNLWTRVDWPESEVKNAYMEVFGIEMPTPILTDPNNSVVYKNGYYGVGMSNFGDVSYIYRSMHKETDGNYQVVFDISGAGSTSAQKFITISPANNSAGFIVKMIASNDN